MIKNVSELLARLAEVEAERLGEFGILHPGTIGDMYEGLTKELLYRALPKHLNLKIVDGFITDGSGSQSSQIDCMLVSGEGESVPYSPGTYLWHVKNVIAVFEIKKNFFSKEISDGFEKMKTVSELCSSWIQNEKENAPLNLDASVRAYSQIVGEFAPEVSDWATMPKDKHMVLHALYFDQIAPVRIVFGYNGFSKERTFRDKFIKFLDGKYMQQGYGVPAIPNLVICKHFSLVKCTGHPFVTPIPADGFWPILASSSFNPIRLLLEVVWTRLSYIESMPELFGDDLEIERLKALLLVKPESLANDPSRWGWRYQSVAASDAELATTEGYTNWEPVELTEVQNAVLMRLCAEEVVNVSDPDFLDFLDMNKVEPEIFIDELVGTTLVARHGDELRLTTKELGMLILPDGRYVAGENNTGRLSIGPKCLWTNGKPTRNHDVDLFWRNDF